MWTQDPSPGTMPKAFAHEFREDVIRHYRGSDSSVAQVAGDFGISPSCLKRWLVSDRRAVLGAVLGLRAQETSRMPCARRTGGSSHWSRRTRFSVAQRRTCRRLICRENDVYPLVRELAVDGGPVA